MRKHSVWIRSGVLVAAGAMILAACGGSSTSKASTGSGIFATSTKKGGTLNAITNSDCDYWDPQRTYYANCWDIQRWFSRQLVTYTPAANSSVLVPDLATSVPTSPDGGQTWTYHLKSGIKFNDGAEITSYDVKYAIERVFATDVINGGPTYVIDELDNPASPYPGPYKDKDPAGLKSIATPDSKTIVFHLNKKFADWNYIMAMPTSTPVEPSKDTGDKYTNMPEASGPYEFASYVPNKSVALVRNPDWSPSTDQVNTALPDKINITIDSNTDDIDNRILAGTADIDLDQNGVQVAMQAKLLAQPAVKAAQTTDDLNGFLRYLSITTSVKPFDNIHCRLAVAWAIDKNAQVIARGGPIQAAPATTMLPPTLKYYSKFDLFPSTGNAGNIAQAKKELALCGQPNGFATKIVSRTRGKEVSQATAIQADLKKIGITATIDEFDASTYYSAVLGVPKVMDSKGYGLAMTAWGADWPAAYGFFSSIVDGRKILPQGNSNYAELNDPAVNAGLDKGTAADPSQLPAIWAGVDKGVVGSGAYVPLAYDKAFNLYSSRLRNVFYTPFAGMTDFAALGVLS